MIWIIRKGLPIALLLLGLWNCGSRQGAETSAITGVEPELYPTVEAVTLLGDTLRSPESQDGDALENYLVAKGQYEAMPEDAEALIWYGRRAAYLGYFQKAIELYSEGIAKHPEDARFYRHRGHRYLSTRQYDKAKSDFQQASVLTADRPDEVEPDGLPNERNIPLSTLQGNIWYHLGLVYYLQDDMVLADLCYDRRVVTNRYDDNMVSGAYWSYMIQRRLGYLDSAEVAIAAVHDKMDIIENDSYYQ